MAKASPTSEFQSTLPRGSDLTISSLCRAASSNFNPRSLAGATVWYSIYKQNKVISIHAPSRERHYPTIVYVLQSLFQSTLPRGSDGKHHHHQHIHSDFNPRSLAGATTPLHHPFQYYRISIHAPSRERLDKKCISQSCFYFNPRSLAGATRRLSR